MSKIIRETHVTGQRGVNLFERYCLHHEPVIIFRETLKSDFGIDGEIEMTAANEEKKTEPTGEILKVQIKTDGTGSSFMKSATSKSFYYYASEADLDYWLKYRNHGLEVILVIVDEQEEVIYCKKVFDYDVVSATATVKKKKNTPIVFDKVENRVELGRHDFRERFSASFRSRVNYSVKETLVANLLKFKQVPKSLFVYESKFKDGKAVVKFIQEEDSPLTFEECPFYVAYGNKVYTFGTLSLFPGFISHVLEGSTYKTLGYDQILQDRSIRSHYTELISKYFKEHLRSKRIFFNARYKRYYFAFFPDNMTVPHTVEATTRVRRTKVAKKVVTWHEYGEKYKFYRHLAFELAYHFIDDQLFLTLAPKYLFTVDGKQTLLPKEITKFTNYLTARDFNDRYYALLDFWWTYLTKDSDVWEVVDYNHVAIKIFPFYDEEVNFGIPMENKVEKRKLRKHIKPLPFSDQKSLFDDEN